MEAASSTTVFSSDAQVSPAISMIERPNFDSCFGTFIGQELVAGGNSGPTKATFGTPHVVPLIVPFHRGEAAAGVDVTVPVSGSAASTSVELGVVLIGGGRLETALYTYSLGPAFPLSLTESLTTALEQRVAAANAQLAS
jgi:hypothetical protein